MPHRFSSDNLKPLIAGLSDLRNQAWRLEHNLAKEIGLVAEEYRPSARNLAHYMALRQNDVRKLQSELSVLGLSSLGRSDACTQAALDAVLTALHRLAEIPEDRTDHPDPPVDFHTSAAMLDRHTRELFGPAPHTGRTYVMVTMPSEAADDVRLVRDLLDAGMDVMRINCAHDGPDSWARTVENLRRAERELGRRGRVAFDLEGPKLRTGAIEGRPGVVKVRPVRDGRGQVVRRARLWLSRSDQPRPSPEPVDAELTLSSPLVREGRRDDQIVFRDTRGRQRQLRLVTGGEEGLLAEIDRTVYVEDGMLADLRRDGRTIAEGRFGAVAPSVDPLLLHVGQRLRVTDETQLGRPERRDERGVVIAPAQIPCTLGQAFADVKVGERIFFDDGRIGGVIRAVDEDGMEVEITQAGPNGVKLRSEKGINLPDTHLRTSGLTEQDVANLAVIAPLADIVALSFVQDPADVLHLEDLLGQHARPDMGIVLKIETKRAFEHLPQLLLASLRSPPVGVMVARGDLAVELGFERLAEVQEEILWLCEAAHVPVIWATQVLESLAKTGIRSRAEFTDAAMAVRAECVMLNKGPHIVETVRVLSDILERMERHQHKKRQMLRRLAVSRFL